MRDVFIRTLAPEEHDRIVGHGPYKDAVVGPDPDHATVVVAEDGGGKLLGYWCAFNAVHVEPLWVAPEARVNGVGRSLWGALAGVLEGHHVPNAFAIIMDEDLPTHLPMAHGIGFRRIPGSVLFVDLVGREKEQQEDREEEEVAP